jgi:hypothetical protein
MLDFSTFILTKYISIQVCYGMIYGIGAKALGQQLDVDENEAAVFIETFKARYPSKILLIMRILKVLDDLLYNVCTNNIDIALMVYKINVQLNLSTKIQTSHDCRIYI